MIVVTGAAGFIGSVLSRQLNRENLAELLLVDTVQSTRDHPNLLRINHQMYLSSDDFLSMMDDFASDITHVVHMGACSSTVEKNWDYLKANNVEYSQKIFRFCTLHQIPLIYASSAATYGDGKLGYSDDHQKIDQCQPLNLYGQSKQEFDQWVLSQQQTPPMWFGLKFFNVFGPNEYHKEFMTSMVYKAYHQITETGQVKLFKSYRSDFKDGEQKRDFVYVKDVSRVIIDLMKVKDRASSGIYNVGTGIARSWNDLAMACFKALNKPVQIDYIDMPESVKNQYQYFTQAESQKLLNLLPLFKYRSLEEGVDDYITHYLSKENCYE